MLARFSKRKLQSVAHSLELKGIALVMSFGSKLSMKRFMNMVPWGTQNRWSKTLHMLLLEGCLCRQLIASSIPKNHTSNIPLIMTPARESGRAVQVDTTVVTESFCMVKIEILISIITASCLNLTFRRSKVRNPSFGSN